MTCPLGSAQTEYDFRIQERTIMVRSGHSEAQINAALKKIEAGCTVDDVARECGVSQATIYTWKGSSAAS